MSDVEKSLESLVERVVRKVLAERDIKPANEPNLVTVAEYARTRSISESTVRQALAENRLDKTKIGRAVRIPANAEIRKRQPTEDAITEHARLVLLRGGKAR